MVFNIIFHPTKTFEDAIEEHNFGSSIIIVLLTSLFLSLSAFFLTASVFWAAYAFAFSLIQWLVFSIIIWFFEFIHVKKRKSVETTFAKCAAVVGRLWEINLIGSILVAAVTFILPIGGRSLMFFVVPIFLFLGVILLLAWIVASFRMLTVLFGAKRLKLVFNWIIINVLNAIMISFISAIAAALL
jgi:hypothetical protein